MEPIESALADFGLSPTQELQRARAVFAAKLAGLLLRVLVGGLPERVKKAVFSEFEKAYDSIPASSDEEGEE